MEKSFSTTQNVGKAKYLVSFTDGIQTHKDGSSFFDIRIFNNKRKLNAFEKGLRFAGYKG